MEKRSGRGDRADVRVGRAPRPPLRRRHDGEPRGAVGRRAAAPGPGGPRVFAGALHALVASAACSACRSRKSRATRAGAWTPARSRGGSKRAASARSWRRSAPRRRDRWIRCRRSWRSGSGTASGCTPTRRTAATSGSPTTSARRRARAFDRIGRGGLDRHRPAQARPAALRLRVRAVPRPGRRDSSTSTTRRTRTSARPSCTSARSAWSARGPGASAVALWATMRLLPLEKGGEFAGRLSASREAALALHARLAADARFLAALRARARHRRLGSPRRARERVLRPRAARLRRGGAARACTSRSRSCPPRSSASPVPGSSAIATASPACAPC